MGKTRELSQSQIIYSKLKEWITNGKLSPGEKITDSKIIKGLNTSRTPFREAVKRLEAKGYVETIHNRGAYVRKTKPREIEKILDVLSVLEGYAVQIAAQRVGAREIKRLEKLNSNLEKLENLGKYKQFFKKNSEFHLLISHLSKNDFLHDLIQDGWERIRRYRFIGMTMIGHTKDYILDHKAVIEAIGERDPEKAGERMKQHIQRTKHIMMNYLREFQTQNTL